MRRSRKVSRAEDAPRLVEGDEYVDLENPGAGVRQVHSGSLGRPGHVLPPSEHDVWDVQARQAPGQQGASSKTAASFSRKEGPADPNVPFR